MQQYGVYSERGEERAGTRKDHHGNSNCRWGTAGWRGPQEEERKQAEVPEAEATAGSPVLPTSRNLLGKRKQRSFKSEQVAPVDLSYLILKNNPQPNQRLRGPRVKAQGNPEDYWAQARTRSPYPQTVQIHSCNFFPPQKGPYLPQKLIHSVRKDRGDGYYPPNLGLRLLRIFCTLSSNRDYMISTNQLAVLNSCLSSFLGKEEKKLTLECLGVLHELMCCRIKGISNLI